MDNAYIALALGGWQTIPSTDVDLVPTTPLTSLVWRAVRTKSVDWTSPTLPTTAIVLPFSGRIDLSITDAHFDDYGTSEGWRAILTRRNGDVTTVRGLDVRADAGVHTPTVMSPSRKMAVHAGDTLEILVGQSSGVNMNFIVVDMWIVYELYGDFGIS